MSVSYFLLTLLVAGASATITWAIRSRIHRLEIELAMAKVSVSAAEALKTVQIRAAELEKEISFIKSLDVKREIVILGQEGWLWNKYLVAVQEDVLIGERVVHSHTTERFWTNIEPNNLKNILNTGLSTVRVISAGVAAVHGIAPTIH